jgi:hypothetical protein
MIRTTGFMQIFLKQIEKETITYMKRKPTYLVSINQNHRLRGFYKTSLALNQPKLSIIARIMTTLSHIGVCSLRNKGGKV